MRCLFAAFLAAALVAGSPHAAEPLRPEDFAAQFPLANVTEGLNALTLTEPVYRAATQRSLRDLRVFNANGDALPFAVLPPAPPAAPDVRVIELKMAALPARTAAREAALQSYALRFERDRDRAVFEIKGEPAAAMDSDSVGGYLIDARPLKDRKGRLLLTFAANAPDYAGRVDILGSEDLVNWRSLASGPLARERRLGEAIERARFDVNKPPSFLRVTWSESASPQIAAAHYEELTPVTVALPRAQLATSLGNDGRSVYVEVPPALPTERLFIRMPQANTSERLSVYRHVPDPAVPARHLGLLPRRAPEKWVHAATVDAFRVMRDGLEVEGQPLVFAVPTDGVRIDATRTFGAVPIVEAEWRPARIAFAARAPGPYRLAAGHENAAASPSLDLRALLQADDPAGMRLPVATVEPLKPGSAGTVDASRAHRIAAQAHWSRVLLWGVLAVAVLGLAWMAWRLAAALRASSTPPGADVRH